MSLPLGMSFLMMYLYDIYFVGDTVYTFYDFYLGSSAIILVIIAYSVFFAKALELGKAAP